MDNDNDNIVVLLLGPFASVLLWFNLHSFSIFLASVVFCVYAADTYKPLKIYLFIVFAAIVCTYLDAHCYLFTTSKHCISS